MIELTNDQARMLMNYLDRVPTAIHAELCEASERTDGDRLGGADQLIRHVIEQCREQYLLWIGEDT
jgi:hypothetical protein